MEQGNNIEFQIVSQDNCIYVWFFQIPLFARSKTQFPTVLLLSFVRRADISRDFGHAHDCLGFSKHILLPMMMSLHKVNAYMFECSMHAFVSIVVNKMRQ